MKNLAIALCRVSTPEQRQNNSLNRQEDNVRKAAMRLNVDIVKWWTGDVSSKVGRNVKRKDLLEAYDFCKANKRVVYLIVDEVDRFMRSTQEMFYWMTKFEQEVGVQVFFASNPEHNTSDAKARLLLSLEGFKAEGSNEERQHKSIIGHVKAIQEGRYTFPPKPGYMKGQIPGVHIAHTKSFIPLQRAFKDVAEGVVTPSDALRNLMTTEFGSVYKRWNMDKFRHFATDPYYAGILMLDKQVKARNENGLHQQMVTKDEHEKLKQVFNKTSKTRGSNKQYNPEFPMNKIMLCGDCGKDNKFTGSIKNNGYNRKTTSYYWKYHCRGCGKAYHRDEVHSKVTDLLSSVSLSDIYKTQLIDALTDVWKHKQKASLDEEKRLIKQVEELNKTKSKLIVELTITDDELKADIKEEIEKTKNKIYELKEKIGVASKIDEDLIQFVEFSLSYNEKLIKDWWNLTHEERIQCQQLIFPGGILFNSNKKVGTTMLSPIYTLATNKKDLRNDRKSLMVELAGTAPASDW